MSSKIGHLIEFGPFRLDAEKHVLWHDGLPVDLALKEVELLSALAENAGEVCTKQELLDRVWADSCVEESNLSRHVYVLRKLFKKFGCDDMIRNGPPPGISFASARGKTAGQIILERRYAVTRTVIESVPAKKQYVSVAWTRRVLLGVDAGAFRPLGRAARAVSGRAGAAGRRQRLEPRRPRRHGHVTDFIHITHWPTFNLADSFIVIGVGPARARLIRVAAAARPRPPPPASAEPRPDRARGAAGRGGSGSTASWPATTTSARGPGRAADRRAAGAVDGAARPEGAPAGRGAVVSSCRTGQPARGRRCPPRACRWYADDLWSWTSPPACSSTRRRGTAGPTLVARAAGAAAGGDDRPRPGSSTGSTATPRACCSSPATGAACARCRRSCAARRIGRTYVALVRGRPRRAGARSRRRSAATAATRPGMSLDTDAARDAVTHFELVEGLPRPLAPARDARDRPHPPDPRPPGGDRPPVVGDPVYGPAPSSAWSASSCTPPSCASPTPRRRAARGALARSRPTWRRLGARARDALSATILRRSARPSDPADEPAAPAVSRGSRGTPERPAGIRHPTDQEDAACPQSPCASCWRPASTSATRPAAGTRRCAASSSASAAASTSSTCSRRWSCSTRRTATSRTSASATAPCSSSARRSRPGRRRGARRRASACRT